MQKRSLPVNRKSRHGSVHRANTHLEIRDVKPPEGPRVAEPAVVHVEKPVSKVTRRNRGGAGMHVGGMAVSSRVLVDSLAEQSISEMTRGDIVLDALFRLANAFALTGGTTLSPAR